MRFLLGYSLGPVSKDIYCQDHRVSVDFDTDARHALCFVFILRLACFC